MRTSILAISLLVVSGFLCATQVEAADIIWASEITDPTGADAGFVTLLQAAGHNVTRFNVPASPGLTPADIALLNASDLVIAGRSVNSGDFQDARAQLWNTQVTAKVIALSPYTTRRSRLGWQAAENVPDSAPTPLVAVNPLHPIFAGVALQPNGTMVNDYNIMVDRGTSTIADALVGGTVIATNPTIAGGAGIAIAEWSAGTTITSNQGNFALAGPRFFFAGGSREANGAAVTTAGVLDLTADGQRLFLNTVDYALAIPEPSTLVLTALGVLLVLVWRKR
jgi:hypothetical protein